MRAEGECPECGATLGVQIDMSLASLVGDSVQRMMDREGNAMYCQGCGGYHDPDDIDVIEDY